MLKQKTIIPIWLRNKGSFYEQREVGLESERAYTVWKFLRSSQANGLTASAKNTVAFRRLDNSLSSSLEAAKKGIPIISSALKPIPLHLSFLPTQEALYVMHDGMLSFTGDPQSLPHT